MKQFISFILLLSLAPFIQLPAMAGWEIYDNFNDGDVDASKWDTHVFRGASIVETTGYAVLSAATYSEPGTSGGTTHVSGVNLTSRLERDDVIKGLRMTYLISGFCDAKNDMAYIPGTIYRPGRHLVIPVGYDHASLLMSTRSLTHDSIATDEQLITNTRITLANNSGLDLENGLKTEIWSRFNDDDGYDGYNVTDHELDATGRYNNDKHTGAWSQMTTQFIDTSIISTSANWTNRKTHYEDPAMRLIENNDPAGGPGWFGVAKGQFSIWFNAAPKIGGAFRSCKIWIDQIEVYR